MMATFPFEMFFFVFEGDFCITATRGEFPHAAPARHLVDNT
jgi:hypothetical protein